MNIHRPRSERNEQRGIHIDSRGQDQPVDKLRAQQTSVGEGCPEEKSHSDSPTPPWDQAGDRKSVGSIPIDQLSAVFSAVPHGLQGAFHERKR
jgi:hypothetical protein